MFVHRLFVQGPLNSTSGTVTKIETYTYNKKVPGLRDGKDPVVQLQCHLELQRGTELSNGKRVLTDGFEVVVVKR